jgi:hypothetical protein
MTSSAPASMPSSTWWTTSPGAVFGASTFAVMSVSTYPMYTPTTWTPRGPSSRRIESVALHRAAFETL